MTGEISYYIHDGECDQEKNFRNAVEIPALHKFEFSPLWTGHGSHRKGILPATGECAGGL